jgi:DNA-binding IclR family transcriptional regulator
VTRVVRLQQLLLLELLHAPDDGDDLERLAWRMGEPRADAESAAGQLVEKGLATRRGEMVAPSRAALELDRLWPLAL